MAAEREDFGVELSMGQILCSEVLKSQKEKLVSKLVKSHQRHMSGSRSRGAELSLSLS